MTDARLIPVRVPKEPAAAVLVLHGGASRRGTTRVSPAQLSVLRMIPIARRIAHDGGNRLAVFRLLNSQRGWDTSHTPADDARWALDAMAEQLGDRLPTALVGHSLGGRAAILAGTAPEVATVVALAPYLEPGDEQQGLAGRRLLIVHGDQDRIADPRRSQLAARSLARDAQVGYIRIRGGKHAMLAHGREFDGYASQYVTATMLGDPARGPVAEVLDAGSPRGEVLVEA